MPGIYVGVYIYGTGGGGPVWWKPSTLCLGPFDRARRAPRQRPRRGNAVFTTGGSEAIPGALSYAGLGPRAPLVVSPLPTQRQQTIRVYSVSERMRLELPRHFPVQRRMEAFVETSAGAEELPGVQSFRVVGPRPPQIVFPEPLLQQQTITVTTVAVRRATEQKRYVVSHKLAAPAVFVPALWWSYNGLSVLTVTLVPPVSGHARIVTDVCGGGATVPVTAGVPILLTLEPDLTLCDALAGGDPFTAWVEFGSATIPGYEVVAKGKIAVHLAGRTRTEMPRHAVRARRSHL